MRTCKNCGCYLPDNWTTCPACFMDEKQVEHKTEKQIDSHKESFLNNICRVDTFHKNNTKTSNVFASYEYAIRFAHYIACESDIAMVIVTDIPSGKIIEKLSRKGY